MKKTILTFALAIILLSCNNKKAENPPLAPTEIATDTIVEPETHSAKNSLAYLGSYRGKLPCADCSGIETSLELSEDFSYRLSRKYLGKSDKTVEQKGTYSWNKAGDAIVLENIKNEPNQYLVGENSLTQLDMNGNKIDGKLASLYLLKKESDAQAETADALTPSQLKFDIVGTHWKLTELNGKPVTNINKEKEFFIDFKPAGDFNAFAGCNNMRGHYELGKDSGIKFLRVMSTMMACPDMKPEDQLKVALETADNFVANEKVLQLRKAGNALAKFEASTAKSK